MSFTRQSSQKTAAVWISWFWRQARQLFLFLHRRRLPQHDGKFLAVTSLKQLISLCIVYTILSFNWTGGTQILPQKEKNIHTINSYKQQHTHPHTYLLITSSNHWHVIHTTKHNLHKRFSLKSTLVFSILFSSTVSIMKRSIFDHLKTEQQELWDPRNPAKP